MVSKEKEMPQSMWLNLIQDQIVGPPLYDGNTILMVPLKYSQDWQPQEIPVPHQVYSLYDCLLANDNKEEVGSNSKVMLAFHQRLLE